MDSSMDRLMIVGYRFIPTDEELIKGFLWWKVNNITLPVNNAIDELNIYEIHPSAIQFDDPRYRAGERYFFVRKEAVPKYESGKLSRRTMQSQNMGGYWRTICGDRQIRDSNNNNVIGYKRSRAFFQDQNRPALFQYPAITNKDRRNVLKANAIKRNAIKGNAVKGNAIRTDSWIMHEYRLASKKLQNWVLCKIIKR